MDYTCASQNSDAFAPKVRIFCQCGELPINSPAASRVSGEKSNLELFRRLAQIFEQLPPTSC